MRTLYSTAIVGLLAMGVGCDDNKMVVAGGNTGECNVSNARLSGTQWVMWEAMPDGTSRENPRARMKFYDGEEGGLKVDYTVGSPYEVQTYDCTLGEKEVNCLEEPKLFDWCLSLEVHEPGSCTADRLKEIGAPNATTAELQKAMDDVKTELAMVAEKTKDDPRLLAQYKLSKNTLANKLQGILDVRVKEKRCELSVSDQYMTLYNGKKIVDSNPVGTNPFRQDKENTWLYENCKEGTKFLALDMAEPPTDEQLKSIDPKRQFSSTDTVYYHYVGLKHVEAEEGCSYSADTWAQWKPKASNVAMNTMDCDYEVPILDEDDNPVMDGDNVKSKRIKKCVVWTDSHMWKGDVEALKYVGDDETSPRAMYGMTRYKTCADGERKKIDTICAAARIMDM